MPARTEFAPSTLDTHCSWCGQEGHSERSCTAFDNVEDTDRSRTIAAVLRALACRDEYMAAGKSIDDASARAFHHLLGGLSWAVEVAVDKGGVIQAIRQVP